MKVYSWERGTIPSTKWGQVRASPTYVLGLRESMIYRIHGVYQPTIDLSHIDLSHNIYIYVYVYVYVYVYINMYTYYKP